MSDEVVARGFEGSIDSSWIKLMVRKGTLSKGYFEDAKRVEELKRLSLNPLVVSDSDEEPVPLKQRGERERNAKETREKRLSLKQIIDKFESCFKCQKYAMRASELRIPKKKLRKVKALCEILPGWFVLARNIKSETDVNHLIITFEDYYKDQWKHVLEKEISTETTAREFLRQTLTDVLKSNACDTLDLDTLLLANF